MSQAFNEFAYIVRKSRGLHAFEGILLALDPGETTGWSVWSCTPGEDDYMVACGQLDTWPMSHCIPNFIALFQKYKPTHIVMESYRVYEWKTDSHAWSDVPTLHVIGCVETLSTLQHLLLPSPTERAGGQRVLGISMQTAQVAKMFITDEKLKSWGLYQRGQRHSRDSMRHGTYFLCFGPQGHNPGRADH